MRVISREREELSRIAASVHWGPLLARSVSEQMAMCMQESKLFEIDRAGNPIAEDFCLNRSPSLYDMYRKHQAEIERRITAATRDKTLQFQPPYGVRYRPEVRPSLATHIDRSRWTCVIYLNGDFTGGELSFPGLSITLRPRSGYGVLFPGGDLYPHRSCPVSNGCKLALVVMID